MKQLQENYSLKAWQFKADPYCARAWFSPTSEFSWEWEIIYSGKYGFNLFAKGYATTLERARLEALERLQNLQYNVLMAKGKLDLKKGGKLRWNNPEQNLGR